MPKSTGKPGNEAIGQEILQAYLLVFHQYTGCGKHLRLVEVAVYRTLLTSLLLHNHIVYSSYSKTYIVVVTSGNLLTQLAWSEMT